MDKYLLIIYRYTYFCDCINVHNVKFKTFIE